MQTAAALDAREAIHRYITEGRRRYAKNTIDSRRPLLMRLAQAHHGHLFDLTAEDIDRWLERAEVQPRTRNVYLGSLRSFYRWAIRRGYTTTNPADDVDRLKTPRALPRPCRTDDLARALEAADPQMRAWLALMAYAGLRCCEVAALHVEDLLWHLDPPLLHVSRHIPHTGPKGGHERVVPLAAAAEEALIAYGLPRAGAIFRRPGSIEPITASHVSVKTRRFLDELDIKATPHQLRHWFATSVYQLTLDIRAVQELLGHANPATTAIYAGFAKSESSAIVRTLGTPPPPAPPS